jgi:uncharacterized protein (UPF0332 family)
MTPFDWEEYLEFAEEQVRRRGNPSAERSAISRAYYAVFHLAKDRYVASGYPLTFRADDHGSVAAWFERSEDREQRRIGINLSRLRQLRRDADYSDTFPGLSREAEAAVELARRLLQAISRGG